MATKRLTPAPGPRAADLPGARKARPPERPTPQLATPVKTAPDGEQWLSEVKFDGYRLLALFTRAGVRLFQREGRDWSEKFAVVRRALARLPLKEALLDGEVVVLNERGVSDFQAMQNFMQGQGVHLVYFVFDLPYCQGYDLRESPLAARKELLRRVCPPVDVPGCSVRLSEHLKGHGQAVFQEACAAGLEGIVAKRGDSPYAAGRNLNWVKVKCSKRQEFVVGGYTAPTGARLAFGALLLGYYEAGRLIYCGRVGTGFTDAQLERLLATMRPLVQADCPFDEPPTGLEARGVKHWLRPELVAEVEFLGWTRDAVLRHPSFKGLREDKAAREVGREIGREPPDPAVPQGSEKDAPRTDPVLQTDEGDPP